MGGILDEKLVIKHLVNGTLGENLCLICLSSLKECYENIFTKICRDEKEYCIADVLSTLCSIEFTDTRDTYNVCIDCFLQATHAYKFYLLAKRSYKVLNIYTELLSADDFMETLPQHDDKNRLCMFLPKLDLDEFDFSLKGVGLTENKRIDFEKSKEAKELKNKEDEVIVVIDEKGESLFYKIVEGKTVLLDDFEKKNYKDTLSKSVTIPGEKVRKKRDPMSYRKCSQCSVKYRFTAKLQHHMKTEHNINLYICKICKEVTEDELEYRNHMKTHRNIHQCSKCNTVFKKRETYVSHLKWHEKMDNIGQSESAHICEVCGVILDSEESLSQHWDSRHHKKFTCYYCGRMYKGEGSFEMHIKKHEKHLQTKHQRNDTKKKIDGSDDRDSGNVKSKCTCSTCGRSFVDERSLMWHERLHNNERPYKCDVCGRGFVSVNRRNQHAVCAHTAPSRRCPLCPALFHLRSMVNTHVKKVHLNKHKRRNRTSKYQNVHWRTEPVPIQELSISIQNEILDMKTAADDEAQSQWIWKPIDTENDI